MVENASEKLCIPLTTTRNTPIWKNEKEKWHQKWGEKEHQTNNFTESLELRIEINRNGWKWFWIRDFLTIQLNPRNDIYIHSCIYNSICFLFLFFHLFFVVFIIFVCTRRNIFESHLDCYFLFLQSNRNSQFLQVKETKKMSKIYRT